MVLRIRYGRTDSSNATTNQEEKSAENDFLNYVRNEESDKIKELSKDPAKCLQLSQNWDLIRKCARILMATESPDLVKPVLEVLTDANPHAFKVGEIHILEGISIANSSQMIVAVLEYWATNKVRSQLFEQICFFF